MTTILVYGERTEIPEGWIVVRGGPIQAGDQWTSQVIGRVVWTEVPEIVVGLDSIPFICVIRREAT